MNLTQQVHEALDAFIDANHVSTNAAAAHLELKRLVGSNDAERKTQRAAMPADEYDRNVQFLAEQEKTKLYATAAAERAEKTLNVLRELLNNETALLNKMTAEISARVAEQYAAISMAPPARPIVLKPAPDPDALPF